MVCEIHVQQSKPMLGGEALLQDVHAIILDEAHERTIRLDLLSLGFFSPELEPPRLWQHT